MKILHLIILCFLFGSADAATWYVDKTATGDGSATTWADATDSVQIAVNLASEGDTVLLAAGSYAEGAEIVINNALTLKGGHPSGGGEQDLNAQTTFLFGSAGQRVVFYNSTSSIGLSLDGLTIQNGESDRGAGIFAVDFSTLHLNHVRVQLNQSINIFDGALDLSGAGIYGYTVNLTNSVVTDNELLNLINDELSSSTSRGAGIHARFINLRNSAVVDNLIVTINGGSGGGIYSSPDTGVVTLIKSEVSRNRIFNQPADIFSSDFTQGGGILGNTVNLINSEVNQNSLTSKISTVGGGIRAINISLLNSTVNNNSATSDSISVGGGIYGPSISLTNSLVAENKVILNSSNQNNISGAGIAGNSPSATLSLNNSILWNNEKILSFSDSLNQYENVILSANNSLVHEEDLMGSNIDATAIGFDPLFSEDYRLLMGSPLIDFADALFLPLDENDLDDDSDVNELHPLDSDNLPRISGVQLDIGPYEFQQNYFVGGTVTGLLSGNSLVLQNNGGDDLSINDDGPFVFTSPVDVNATYGVTILTSPGNPIQTCMMNNQTGTISNSDITDVQVICEMGDDLIYRTGFEL